MLNRKFLTLALSLSQILAVPSLYGAERSREPIYTKPLNLGPRASAEYFSTVPEAGLLIPINIWGNVREPGIHFVPSGSNLLQSLSAAGGPTESADISAVRILRKNQSTYTDLLKSSAPPLVQANDMIYVHQTYKAELPLIFSGISTVISLVTLYFILNDRKK